MSLIRYLGEQGTGNGERGTVKNLLTDQGNC